MFAQPVFTDTVALKEVFGCQCSQKHGNIQHAAHGDPPGRQR